MGISLRPEHLQRYRHIARLLIRYGRSDLVRQARLDEVLGDESATTGQSDTAESLADDLEAMGPTFIKLGQLLSSRPDLLPPAYIDSLSRLQDSVEPFPFEDVHRIIGEELGVRVSKAFLDIDRKPIAAASLGQVHRATLRDGREVVVKVQRPGIREQVSGDLDVLEEIAGFLDEHTDTGHRYAVADVLAQFRRSLTHELDYLREADNLRRLRQNLADFERIVVPVPVEDYTTSRVLTMDFVAGQKITELSPMRLAELDGKALADELFRAYLQQILVDGFFHADPHPGNVFLTRNGRIALIDLGMIGRITPNTRDDLMKLVLAISEGRGDDVAAVAIRTGRPLPDFDEQSYRREIGEVVAAHQGAVAEEIQAGRVVLEISRIAGRNGLRPSPELSLLGKALLNLDLVGRVLDPEFDPNAAIQRHAAGILQQRLLQRASPASLFTSMLEMNELAQTLPGRLNQALDTVAANRVEVRVRLTEEIWMMASMQKIANRITMGLVLAAMIIGAAMLMQVDTDVRILGYPAVAMILFLGAIVGGVTLLVGIIRHDPKAEARSEHL
jgi:ubiquinone biosynthesis protein